MADSSSGGDGSDDASPGSTSCPLAADGENPCLAACEQAAQTYCQRLQNCAPFLLTERYGDLLICEVREIPSCTDALQAPGSGWTLSSVVACASAQAALSCSDFVHGKPLPAACQVTGSVATGAGCLYDPQCSTGYCAVMSTCGHCTALAASGDKCTTSSDCEANLLCASSGVCAAPVASGNSCDAAHPCAGGLACLGGTCTMPHALGANCDPANASADCDADQGLFCAADSTCHSVAVFQPGDSCSGAVPAICAGGGTCWQGTCLAPVADGASCDPANGENCLIPATCQGGTCAIELASACH